MRVKYILHLGNAVILHSTPLALRRGVGGEAFISTDSAEI